MTEEKREDPPDQEVLDILNDLNAILSDFGADQGFVAQPQGPESAASSQVPSASPEGGVHSAPPLSMISAPVPFVPPTPKPAAAPSEPRNDPTEPVPCAISPVKPPLPPSQPAPSPASATAPARPSQRGLPLENELPDISIPENVGKDQIRRVAYLYLGKFEAVRDTLAQSLDHTAQTVPKKPLYLRQVLNQVITEDCDGKEVLARVLQAKAVAVLGITEGLSDRKLRQFGEIFSSGGIMFRSVAPLDAGKKSLAIDIVVDVMLLPSEAP